MFPPSAVTESEVPVGRRSRKRSQTKAALADAALRLFAEKGYENTTIEEITEVVDISSRTFFRYFPSKEDVLFTDVDHEPFLAAIRAQPLDSNDLEAVRDAYISMLPNVDSAVTERTVLLKKALESTPALQGRNLQLQLEFRIVIAGALAQRRGLSEPDSATVLAAAIAQAVMHLAFDHWATADGQSDVRDQLRTFFALAEGAIRAPGSSGV
jgi:AcrR family transcriptional regulator